MLGDLVPEESVEEPLGGDAGEVLVAFWGGKESALEEVGKEGGSANGSGRARRTTGLVEEG